MSGENLSGLEEHFNGIRLGPTRGKSFVENAEERVSEKFRSTDWKVV